MAPVTLDLTKAEVQKPEGAQPFDLDVWPVLLFLKGIGFQRIMFHPNSVEAIDLWAERMQSYENEFIQDPENFSREEYVWNEKKFISDDSEDQIIIELFTGEPRFTAAATTSPISLTSVPPMEAPIGISADSIQNFLDEVKRQSPQEVFQRMLSILVEYEREARSKDESFWAQTIGHILAVALRSQLLDKAIRIVSEHRANLLPVWKSSTSLQNLLGAYDPKPSELQAWAELFEPCPTEVLIELLEKSLSTEAGPQILKLMNYRAQRNPDHLIPLIRSQTPSVQRLLMQWLAPHWRAKHVFFLESSLSLAISGGADEELLAIWLTAYIRSSPKEAFEKLRMRFKSPKWFWKKIDINPIFQRALLRVLFEFQSVDALEFLKAIRKNISPEFLHQVDKIIGTYGKGSPGGLSK